MPIVSSHVPQSTSDCCCRFLCKRGRCCQARAIMPKRANGKSQTICPARGWVKRRSGPAVPISKIPPAGPPDGGCRPAPFPPKFGGPPVPNGGGVPGVEAVPLLVVVPEGLVAFEVFA